MLVSSPEQQLCQNIPIRQQRILFPSSFYGGGLAGTYCARALSAGLFRNAADVVALVADQNAMLFHPTRCLT